MKTSVRSVLGCSVLLAGSLALGACGSSSTPQSSSPAPATTAAGASASSAASSASESGSASASGSKSAATKKVNANSASKEDIAAALKSANVPNSDKMASEIEEYRPYTAANLPTKLGEELGKYGVDKATLQKILSVLTV